jgi:phosphatidylglycerol:prolipoprotein diacylglycerol transferase
LGTLSDFYASLDPIAFSLGPLQVRWYGLAYLAAFIIAPFVIWLVSKRWKLDIAPDDLFTLVVAVAFGVVLGGRLGYVCFYGNGYYLAHPAEIFMFSEGGMSFHGGLIGAVVGAFVASRILKIPFLVLADLGAIVTPIGLFFGRVANFINGELWGKPTDLPWGVVFSSTGGGLMPRHPTQLYEALLEGVVLFIVLIVLARRYPPRPRGTFLGTFLVLYACFRCAIEFVRVPDVQLGYLYGGFLTMGMVLCIPMLLIGIALLYYAHRAQRPQVGHVAAHEATDGHDEQKEDRGAS